MHQTSDDRFIEYKLSDTTIVINTKSLISSKQECDEILRRIMCLYERQVESDTHTTERTAD